MQGLADEPSLREQLLADYVAHEDRVEQAANVELWELGDWLAKYVPPRHPGPQGVTEAGPPISLDDLAEHGRRGLYQLRVLRKVALATEADRLPLITFTAYHEALRASKWDLMAANARLLERGHRKRDQRDGPHESLDAITREASKRPPEDRAELVRTLSTDPTVRELMRDEPVPDFGAAWANTLVLRVHDQAGKLAAHVKREGLVFAPNTELDTMLKFLRQAEAQIADVRAAVQERVQDAQLGEVA
jgi:hypothetical protein